MGGNKDYKPDVYKRLELVQKQFKTNTAEQRKQQSVARRREFWERLKQNQIQIRRIALYTVLGAVLTAVILTVVFDKV